MSPIAAAVSPQNAAKQPIRTTSGLRDPEVTCRLRSAGIHSILHYRPARDPHRCLPTLTGAQQFCTIRSYLATAAKHGIHFFEALTTLAQGGPWLSETT
jgi:hypothetical protein